MNGLTRCQVPAGKTHWRFFARVAGRRPDRISAGVLRQRFVGCPAANAYAPQFTEDEAVDAPARGTVWRTWPFIVTPLTPNALNDGEAPFPEFHSVYIDPESWKYWVETGEFRDGTSPGEGAGVGLRRGRQYLTDRPFRSAVAAYFMGDFRGFEIAFKSAEHFPERTGQLGLFSTFGHHAPPYAATIKEDAGGGLCRLSPGRRPTSTSYSRKFYPVLRASKPKN